MSKVGAATKKHRALIVILLALIAALAFVCVWLYLHPRAAEPQERAFPESGGNGLFSWHDEVFDPEEREILFELMRSQGLTELYQDVPFNLPAAEVIQFCEACRENGIRPYLLIGEPEWALDKSGTGIRTQIQRAALMGFAGVMVDVEPGSTSEWKDDRASVMTTMTRGFLRGKTAAEENSLEMLVCLSYYYDDYGFGEELETIVEQGCDGLAIMNYDREDEIGQIETEAALCKTYGKRLVNIYELQEVGKYDLEESHTYREAGLPALWESSEKLRDHYGGQKISTALHEYRALKTVAGEQTAATE